MKKGLLLTTIALIIGGAFYQANAQNDEVVIGNRIYETKKFRFGAYIAPTIAWMKPTTSKTDEFETSSNGSSLGFQYGLMAEYQFANNYALVSGLQMNMAKGKIIATNSSLPTTAKAVTNADFSYKLNYVEIPLALKMRTDPIENFRFFGQVGFTLGANIGKKADYTVNYLNDLLETKSVSGTNEKLSGTLAVAPINLSMNIGVGAEYPISNKLSAYLGLFFNNGFVPDATGPTNYTMYDKDIDFKDGNVRMNNFAFRLGIFF